MSATTHTTTIGLHHSKGHYYCDPLSLWTIQPATGPRSRTAFSSVRTAYRRDHTEKYFRLDDLANQLAVYHRSDPDRLAFPNTLHSCHVLVLDDFLTTPITNETAAELLNILAAREGKGSTVVTPQFDPQASYKSLLDAVIAESILNRIVSNVELIELDGPNMRRHLTPKAEQVPTRARAAKRDHIEPLALPERPTTASKYLGYTGVPLGRQSP